ncbi:MAG: hypothetical protein JW993_18770 [Sedimentisphaerales bacterium]|nr:hypothetical protein [Sedimentisphaerales bacterium]
MATLSHESVEQSTSRPHHGPEQRVHRVTLYLRSVGLPAEQAGRRALNVTREVQQQLDNPAEDLTSAAIDRVMDMVGQWLDELSASVPDASEERRLQLAWFLRPVLMRHAEMFLHREGLSQDFDRAIQAAGTPMRLPPVPTEMPPQALGELPRLWYRLLALGNMVWDRLVGVLEQRQAEP